MIVVENFSRRGAIISKILLHGLVTMMVVEGLHLARPSSWPLLPLLVWGQNMPHGFRAPLHPWGDCWEERERERERERGREEEGGREGGREGEEQEEGWRGEEERGRTEGRNERGKEGGQKGGGEERNGEISQVRRNPSTHSLLPSHYHTAYHLVSPYRHGNSGHSPVTG